MSETTFTADRLDALADAPHALDLTVPELRELVRVYRERQNWICPETYALTLQAVAAETKAKLAAEEKLRELSKGSPRPEAHTTQGMSEAAVLAVIDGTIEGTQIVADKNRHSGFKSQRQVAGECDAAVEQLRDVRSTIESTYAELAQVKTERDEFRAAYAYLLRVAPWSESNDMAAGDEMISGIDGLLQRARDAEFERSELRNENVALREKNLALRLDIEALTAMVRRLVPYARLEAERHAERGGDGGETESVIDAAESLLAQIEGLTDQSTEQRG